MIKETQNAMLNGHENTGLLTYEGKGALIRAWWKISICKQKIFWTSGTVQICRFSIKDVNDIHKEIKSKFKAGNSCNYSDQILLSSQLTSVNFKIETYKRMLYGSVSLREKHKLKLLGTWPKRDENGNEEFPAHASNYCFNSDSMREQKKMLIFCWRNRKHPGWSKMII